MSLDAVVTDVSVDVAFALEGLTLPRDHAQVLQQALCQAVPWLGAAELAGVHPVKLVPGTAAVAMLSKRTRLLIRLGSERARDLMSVSGLSLDIAGNPLRLGDAQQRELQPHSTLYAYRVASDTQDEVEFMAKVYRELADLAIGGERVCGKHQCMQVSGQPMDTFSLMLHALAPEQSLRLQQHGLGTHRLLGCGIFVPHKSAAAV
jgi:CRISPR-associated protein Cas6